MCCSFRTQLRLRAFSFRSAVSFLKTLINRTSLMRWIDLIDEEHAEVAATEHGVEREYNETPHRDSRISGCTQRT
jgi:hypothetical protein